MDKKLFGPFITIPCLTAHVVQIAPVRFPDVSCTEKHGTNQVSRRGRGALWCFLGGMPPEPLAIERPFPALSSIISHLRSHSGEKTTII
jgi:hypothetical protein